MCIRDMYDKTFENIHVAYKPQVLQNTLGEYLAKQGKKQFRIAETEKYAHVTFFFNGGVEHPILSFVRLLHTAVKKEGNMRIDVYKRQAPRCR